MQVLGLLVCGDACRALAQLLLLLLLLVLLTVTLEGQERCRWRH